MTPDEQRRLEDLLHVFTTPGWRHLIDDFSDVARQLDTIHGVDSVEQLHRNKGKLDCLQIFLTYEDTVRRIMEDDEVV